MMSRSSKKTKAVMSGDDKTAADIDSYL
jgi:hypothetical protein